MGGQRIQAYGEKRTRIDRHSRTPGLLHVRLLPHEIHNPEDRWQLERACIQEIIDEPC